MATSKRLNSELKSLEDAHSSLYQYQLQLLKETAIAYYKKYGIRRVEFPSDAIYMIYTGGEYASDTEVLNMEWDENFRFVLEAKLLLEYDVFKDYLEMFQSPFLDIIYYFVQALDQN